jgi:uncharacterized membrane protein YvbJ
LSAPTFFCENCGFEVNEEDDRCPNCGRRFGGVKCPRCHLTATKEAFHNGCPRCHYQFSLESAAPAPKNRKKGSESPAPRPHAAVRERSAWPAVIVITTLATLAMFLIYSFSA